MENNNVQTLKSYWANAAFVLFFVSFFVLGCYNIKKDKKQSGALQKVV